jgi:predicted HD phosphohydrolase
MSETAAREFESRRFSREAVQLRRWDDLAKVQGLLTLTLRDYRDPNEATAIHK